MTVEETAAYIKTFLAETGDDTDVDVVIIPPFTALAKASELISEAYSLKLGAQNMNAQKSGAFTGEISAAMLRELFVRYVVLGHSERRQLFGETDAVINEKIHAAHEATLKPIFCIGETLAERDGGQVEAVLSRQLRAGLAGLGREARFRKRSSPTNRSGPSAPDATPRPTQAQDAHAFIRREVAADHGSTRRRAGPHPVRRQREAVERRRADGRAGHRRRARRRREPRPARFRRDRQGGESWRRREPPLRGALGAHIFKIAPATPYSAA